MIPAASPVPRPGTTRLTTFSVLEDEARQEKKLRKQKVLDAKRKAAELAAKEKTEAALAKISGQSWADLSDLEDSENEVSEPQIDVVEESEESESEGEEPQLKKTVPEPPKKDVSQKKELAASNKKSKEANKQVDDNDIDGLIKELNLNAVPAAKVTALTEESESPADGEEPDGTGQSQTDGTQPTIKASERLRANRTAPAKKGEAKEKKSNAEKKKEKKEKKMMYGR